MALTMPQEMAFLGFNFLGEMLPDPSANFVRSGFWPGSALMLVQTILRNV
jgi:hypothetical protein